MPESRLYVKIVMPKQGVEKKKPGGGGKAKPFAKVTPKFRSKLIEGLESAEQFLARSSTSLQKPIVPLKVTLNSKALAKSHWQNALFSNKTCPIVGAGRPGELYLKGSSLGIGLLKKRIEQGSSPQVEKEISAVKELRGLQPEDRLEGKSASALFASAPSANGRKALKIKLFDYAEGDVQRAQIADFESQLQAKGISAIRHSQYKMQDIYTVTCKDAREVDFLANVVSVRSISAISLFRTLRQARINSRPAAPDLLSSVVSPGSCPIVAVVDSGVANTVPALEPWIYRRERYVARAEENTYHGTFVAGLLTFGHALNPRHPEIGSHPCRILDIHVLPNTDPTFGAVGTITEAELLQDLDQMLLKYSNEVKVWNLSLGSDEICKLDRFSDFAVQIDNLQQQFGVTFVIAAGNYEDTPLLSFPRDKASAAKGRITSPADSVLGITVGSISQLDHPVTGTKKGEPSPFSRHGPGPNHIIKPDLVHFGGNISKDFSHPLGMTSLDNGPQIVEDVGTSFAAPLVARQLASIYHDIAPTPSATLARAILTHNAVDIRTRRRVADGNDQCLGFGTPMELERALECQPWAMTMVFEESLRPGFYLEWDNFPYPESLTSDGKFTGEIWMTLAYPPLRNPNYGSEYCETHVAAHFGVYRQAGTKEKFVGLVPPEHKNKGLLYETHQVSNLRKWAPVRTYHRMLPKGTNGMRWRLCLELLCRHDVDNSVAINQPFALLLTIADPKRKAPIYDEMMRNLRNRFQTQDLALRTGIRVQSQT